MVDIRRTRHGWHVRAYFIGAELDAAEDTEVARSRLLIGDDSTRVKLDTRRPVWARQVLFNRKRQEVVRLG